MNHHSREGLRKRLAQLSVLRHHVCTDVTTSASQRAVSIAMGACVAAMVQDALHNSALADVVILVVPRNLRECAMRWELAGRNAH